MGFCGVYEKGRGWMDLAKIPLGVNQAENYIGSLTTWETWNEIQERNECLLQFFSNVLLKCHLLYGFRNQLEEAERRISSAFGENAVSADVVQFRFRRFKNGNKSSEDEQSQDRPDTYSNEEI